ncbi:MAG: ThiamineS protein [Thermoanaerobacterales bacterium 50_218]|nr:MAG: ThiamineS protein [Thermoanaerobacterales bacterium 50_218]HAA89025.1 thiamine biosynthesis protein ThiS [Peptococcaceae bacterium]
MKVKYQGKVIEVKGNRRGKEVLRELGINPETVLVIREGELVTEDTMLSEDDQIEIISVISGG